MSEQSRINYDVIPNELRALDQWVWWKGNPRPDGKLNKVPMDAKTGWNASHSDPKTWASFEQAKAYHESHSDSAGIGFVFSENENYVGIDLDHCIKAGKERIQLLDDVERWACDFIGLCATYSEVSPSGTGIKLILKGKMPGNKGRRNDHYETGGIEIYPHHRFFTLTGQHLEGTPLEIAHNTDALVEICDRVFGGRHDEPKSEPRKPSEAVTDDEKALIEKAKSCEKNGVKFTRLWEGDCRDYLHEDGTPDPSRADLALCSYLAFWTQKDAARIDRLFRQSGLYRDKWERNDYRSWTISKAIEGAAQYDPNYRSGKPPSSKPDDPPPPNGTDGASQTDASQAPPPNGSDDKPTDAPKSQEKKFDDIRRRIGEAAIGDEPFKRNQAIEAIIQQLVDLSPVNQATFIDKMKSVGLGTKATLDSQLKSAIQAQKAEKRQPIVHQPQLSALPNIVINTRQMREITADTLDAIQKVNAANPFLFVRSGILTRVKVDEKGYALAQNLTVDGARGIMGRVANFLKETNREDIGTTYSAVSPPEVIAKDILSLPSYPQFLPLVSVVGFPILSESGEFRTQTGYDPESRCYYHAAGKTHIGNTFPTEENVQNAKRFILDELLGDFPFVDKASLANTVAEMLTPLVRPLIKGATPLFAHDAATPGTGKTLLASVCTIPFSLSGASVMTAGRDDDEWRKRITAKLMTGASHILIDNIKTKLSSGDLSAALTAKSDWEDRILGQSQMIRLPVRCVWVATGNNLDFSDEIARRAVWIRLDAKVERPWRRTDFKHQDLESWVEKHRSEILTALMVFVKKWFAEGKPAGEEVMGSYSEWTQVVGGILKAVGIDRFLENAEELYEQVDTEREAWVEFFKAWASEFGAYDEKSGAWGAWVETDDEHVEWKRRMKGDEVQAVGVKGDEAEAVGVKGDKVLSVGVKELFLIASHDDDPATDEGLDLLETFLGKGNHRARKTNLGRLLRKHRDRVFGGYRLEVVDQKVKGAAQFRLVNQKPTGEPGGEPSDLGSPTQKSSHDKGFNPVLDTPGEPSEPNTTPSGKNAGEDNTSGRISGDGAGVGSLGSPDPPQIGQEPSRGADFRVGEPNLARFTTDPPQSDPHDKGSLKGQPQNDREELDWLLAECPEEWQQRVVDALTCGVTDRGAIHATKLWLNGNVDGATRHLGVASWRAKEDKDEICSNRS